LCLKNLPPEQKGIPFQEDFLLLINPFPIFPTHLTIPNLEHTPQQIPAYFADMLDLSRELTDFTVFYNGPQTGASAPDHFHFQAGIKGLLPVESELENLKNSHSEILLDENDLTVFAVENYLRRFIAIQSGNKEKLQKIFQLLFEQLPPDGDAEPLLNVLCNFEYGKWNVLVFPREKQRPSHFYRTGEKQVIVSPASVELGGMLILPRKEDFEKITKDTLSEIFSEVTMQKYDFRNFVKEIKCQ
jgi:ATP adenylyltransferase/5',5'''-P-1,P-4-tetraphosphate phosphorylase II